MSCAPPEPTSPMSSPRGSVDTGRMLPENAAALVGAGMLSVLIFPLIGFSRLRPANLIPEDSTLYVSDDIDAPDPRDDLET